MRQLELVVGLFILAGIAALMVLAFKVSNINQLTGKETYVLKAHFENVGGLKVRSPVKVGGVVVGRVTRIDLDQKYMTPVVSLSIANRFNQFSSETTAAIQTAGLLGEQYVALTPGGDELMLGDGDEIEDTQSALVLEELIGQFLFSDRSGDI